MPLEHIGRTGMRNGNIKRSARGAGGERRRPKKDRRIRGAYEKTGRLKVKGEKLRKPLTFREHFGKLGWGGSSYPPSQAALEVLFTDLQHIL